MRHVLLAFVGWEGDSVHHIVVNVDLLDANIGEGNAEAQGAGPVMFRKSGQGYAIRDDHQTLHSENRCENVPHINHLLGSDFGE